MSDNKHHIDPQHNLGELDELLFEKATIPFQKDKSAVLNEIMTKSKSKTLWQFTAVKIAASLLLLAVAAAAFSRFHTKTISTESFKMAEVELPDGSQVKLNETSQLSYHPFWWWANRSLQFEGEGFFEVEKGSQFSVVSEKGTTTVLGTSFNINTHDDQYQVFCKTGKVQVVSDTHQVVLEPNDMANLTETGELNKTTSSLHNVLQWTNGLFHFENMVLTDVFNQLESHYNVTIKTHRGVDLYTTYTAVFTRPASAYDALETICLSHNLQVEQVSETEFLISK